MSPLVCLFAVVALMQPQPGASLAADRSDGLTVPGDPARGRMVFQSETVGCSGCHTVGPDLQGIGDKYPQNDLIQAVLDPDAFVLTGYAATTLVTDAGTVHESVPFLRLAREPASASPNHATPLQKRSQQ